MKKLLTIFALATLTLCVRVQAVKIADVTRLSGQRTNVLTGLGLVYGLKGTGDGGDYLPAIRALSSMLGKFNDAATVQELSKSQNVAIVNLAAIIPSAGARSGDHIDVRVMSIGSAATLKGGRLFICPMQGPVPMPGADPFALADGPIDLEDPSSPNVGIVHGGAVMEEDFRMTYVENGHFSLILEAPNANSTTANLIAKTINGAESVNGEDVAAAVDAKEVLVVIPPAERDHPDSFISRVQQLPVIMLASEARVTINRRGGSLIVTGDVEIGPAVINQQGMTIITTSPPPPPGTPIVTRRDSVALDTANQGGARLQDLMAAMDQLRVPVDDKISILEQLYRSGKLPAKLVYESN
ncbi:MAG TPA: flagellar basal body P-ring protein FlgI [Tepidisphaeraceae bacterium]|jgi:flagellar P-ring protein precursor FlgI|nr:flagellar basal body P-ring protein FlgI [Tepidisphaeraceae bacterium]